MAAVILIHYAVIMLVNLIPTGCFPISLSSTFNSSIINWCWIYSAQSWLMALCWAMGGALHVHIIKMYSLTSSDMLCWPYAGLFYAVNSQAHGQVGCQRCSHSPVTALFDCYFKYSAHFLFIFQALQATFNLPSCMDQAEVQGRWQDAHLNPDQRDFIMVDHKFKEVANQVNNDINKVIWRRMPLHPDSICLSLMSCIGVSSEGW